MATVKQIYTIVNALAEQSLGMKGLEPTNASFISVGEEVFSSETNTDAWYKALVDRIGRTVFSMRAYKGNADSLKKEPFEYGSILQKIYVDIKDAGKNDTWNGVGVAGTDPFEKFENDVRQKLFSKISTWEFDSTIPDVQMKTAFTSAEQMNAFIESVFMAVNNSMELSFENLANLCRASFIARKSEAGNGNTYINLLGDYNAETNAGLTIASCLKNVDFLKYCASRISLATKQMATYSRVFNEEEFARHTPRDMQNVDILANFATAMAMYLQANTYHKELVEMPRYNEVTYWQGSGTNFAFNDVSAIKVLLEEDGETVELGGVVAVVSDVESMGVTINNKRTKSIYNPRGEYTNYFAKADMGYFNDMSENGIVFYLAEA